VVHMSLNPSSILCPAKGLRRSRCDSRFRPSRHLACTLLRQRPWEVVVRDTEGDRVIAGALEGCLAASQGRESGQQLPGGDGIFLREGVALSVASLISCQ